jgi:hypothetical protein
MRNSPLKTLNTPRLFANAIRRARRLAKRSGSPTDDQTPACASTRSQADECSMSNTHACTGNIITIACKRAHCEDSEPPSKRACLSSRGEECLLPYATQMGPQVLFSNNSMFLQSKNINLNSELRFEPNNFQNMTASPTTGGTRSSFPAASAASWNPQDITRFPQPSTPDLLRLLRASLASSVSSTSASIPAPTQRIETDPPQPPFLPAHGAGLLAFLQGVAWAAALRDPGRADILPPLHCTTALLPPPSLPAAARTFLGAGPAWQPGLWTAATGAAPSDSAYRPVTAGR